MRKFSAAFLLFLVATAARGEWIEKNSRDEDFADARVLYRHVDLQDLDTGKSAIVDLAIFSAKSCKLRMIDNAEDGNNLMNAMRLANCIAGVNGGYFDTNFAPLGLRVVDGKTTSRSVPVIAPPSDIVPAQRWPIWEKFWRRRLAISKFSAHSISTAAHRAHSISKASAACFGIPKKRQCATLSESFLNRYARIRRFQIRRSIFLW